jgi:hypothetical protein
MRAASDDVEPRPRFCDRKVALHKESVNARIEKTTALNAGDVERRGLCERRISRTLNLKLPLHVAQAAKTLIELAFGRLDLVGPRPRAQQPRQPLVGVLDVRPERLFAAEQLSVDARGDLGPCLVQQIQQSARARPLAGDERRHLMAATRLALLELHFDFDDAAPAAFLSESRR